MTCLPGHIVIDYASASIQPTRRYSRAVIFSFTLSLLPILLVTLRLFFAVMLPGWFIMGVTPIIFVMNLGMAFRLLELPPHVLGDGLSVSGVMISGLAMLVALLVFSAQMM
jgi:hypothetical protein